MNPCSRAVVAVLTIASLSSLAEDALEKLLDKKAAQADTPVITNRTVTKAGKTQIVGPLIGFADRKDLYSHTPVSVAIRKYFGESHAWEVGRLSYDIFSLTSTAEDVVRQTGYVVDSRQAFWTISTGYVYYPIYGKYAFSEDSLIHFDGYVGFSIGARFANSLQVVAEPFLGMQHYLTPAFSVVLPEIRARFYSEGRTNSSDFISEFICQAGVAWLF